MSSRGEVNGSQLMWDDFEDRRIDAAAEARNNMPELEWIGLLVMMSLMWLSVIGIYINHQKCIRRKRMGRTIHERAREAPAHSTTLSAVSAGYRNMPRLPMRPPRMTDIEDDYANICRC